MKKKYLAMAVAISLVCSMTLSSCIGSFTLTNKLLGWNRQVGNKFVNELVFFAFWVLPVYEVSGLADLLVLNSIEFWSGENPVARNSSEEIDGSDGHRYLVECDGKGYTITDETEGTSMRLDFDAEESTWSVSGADGNTYELFTFVDPGHVSMPVPGGGHMEVELSEAGLMAYRQMATASLMAAR